MGKQNRTDKYLHKLKDHPVLSVVIVIGICALAILPFYSVLFSSDNNSNGNPTEIKNDTLHHNLVTEYDYFDYTMEYFQPENLRKENRLHEIVARRDAEMHFFVPNNWDYIEPTDGPAGLRFKTYYYPKDSRCIISAYADIVCLEDLISEDNIDILGSIDTQISDFKELSGLETTDPEFGYCNLADYANHRIEQCKTEVDSFNLISQNPALKYIISSPSSYFQIESRRIKYSFIQDNEKFIVMEVMTYFEDVIYSIYLGSPEKIYYEVEEEFSEISTYLYLQKYF